MKQKNGYLLQYISGIPYLLPYGQKIADHRRGVQLNETGVLLWNLISEELPREEVFKRFFDYFGADETQKAAMREDAEAFFTQLRNLGMIEDEAHHPTQPSFSKYLNIGGLIMKLSGDSAMFSSEFDAFEICNKNEMSQNLSSPDLEIRVHNTFLSNYEYGRLLLRSTELEIFEREEDYLFLFPRAVHIDSAFLKKDGTCADFFCHPVSDENFVTDLFHAIRFIYLYTAQKHNIFALHSASILYREKIWLFSGPSGTGKSTHTNLWKKIFHTPVINGDLNLIALTGHDAVTHGLPWCGTSQISDTHSYPLGGIILLKQAAEDYIVELSEDEKALMTMQRLISPCWNPAQLQSNLDFTQKLAKQVLICRLCCTKNRSAAEVMKEYIDSKMDI